MMLIKMEEQTMREEMTRQERLLAAIRRQPLDRLPTQIDFSPHMLDIMCDHYCVPRRGEEELLPFLDNHLVYGFINDTYGMLRKRTPGNDIIAFDNWQCGWDMTQEGIFPAVHPLADDDAYGQYEFPDPNAPGLMNLVEQTIHRYSADYIVASYQVTLLFERAYALRGYENFLCDLVAEPEFAEELLEKITLYQIAIAKRYVQLGVSCGRIGDDYGTQNGMLFSPQLWRDMFKNRLRRIISVYKDAGLPVIMHSCGNVLPIIPDLIEIGVDVLNNVQPEAMPRETLMPFNGKLTFYGGFSTQHILPSGTEEEIFADVNKCRMMYGQNNGCILSPGISIISDVPIKNVNTLLRAFNELNGSKNIIRP
jgi:uroporphyrinogen decarboxylase